jgi:hypothetical protein
MMRQHDRVLWALAAVFCGALLIAPALWNGFPLLQYDTGGYLARWYEGTLVPSRAVTYGLMLTAASPMAFWPLIVLQAALTVWVIAITLRTHGFGQALPLVVAVTILSVVSTLPWLTAILLTDIFCGLAVLAFYLLMMRGEKLTTGERAGLTVLIAVSGATHSATLAVLVVLCACVLPLWLTGRVPSSRLANGLLALALGATMVFTANAIVANRLAWTPGGVALSFGRMLQDGIVKRYLDDHCPDAKLQLCAYKDELPADADIWFWGSPLFDKLGRFAGLDAEMQTIAFGSLIEYPVLQGQTAAVATVKQLLSVHTGEGVVDHTWHTYRIIERYTPELSSAMHAARQQRGEISFGAVNYLQYPVALIAMACLPVIVLLAARRSLPVHLGELAAACTVALLANAFICGTLSNPHDRYGARLVWVAVFAVLVTLFSVGNRLGTRRDIS